MTVIHPGIFAKTFMRPNVEDALDAVAAHGFRSIQFNMACAGVASMPDDIDPALATRIAGACLTRGITMAAVSGTFNIIHPDEKKKSDGLRRLRVLAAACATLGTRIITLSTGTRDAENMWRRHAENGSAGAWRDLCASMQRAVQIADEFDVVLAFEPEVSNVVDTALKARRLVDEIASPRLQVLMDGANLFHEGELPHMREILDRAFDLLGKDIVLAHAKDLSRDGEAGDAAAGTGKLDYDHYLALLHTAGYAGPLILHGLAEAQVPSSLEFLERKIGAALRSTGR